MLAMWTTAAIAGVMLIGAVIAGHYNRFELGIALAQTAMVLGFIVVIASIMQSP